ncbi:hypothetical protein SLEP1_g10840 [Rubroshorea leprosula]|uniref:Uncharacterized protein n=1 Tax=Rubroshorea leprosula TaxID=152421 RepID=A0AAV5IIU0_9ROSI|nr:hypothetical protein SLEP1_g10840 [Rubroshorea leprosula]
MQHHCRPLKSLERLSEIEEKIIEMKNIEGYSCEVAIHYALSCQGKWSHRQGNF